MWINQRLSCPNLPQSNDYVGGGFILLNAHLEKSGRWTEPILTIVFSLFVLGGSAT